MNQVEVSLAYTAARDRVAWAELQGWGWLHVTGRDRLDFFQRLSTNDFRGLQAGQGEPTVLTSPTGRVMASVIVYVGSDMLHVRTEPGQAAGVARYLNRMIFWNDEIQVTDASDTTGQWALYGPRSLEALAGLFDAAPLAVVPPYGWRPANIAGDAAMICRGGPLETPTWTLVAARPATGLAAALAGLGPQVDQVVAEQLRIENGVPAWGHELSEQVTPVEAGLMPAINFSKGCYTGQEIIARQVNYDKIPRQLAGLLLPAEAWPAAQALAGAPVSAGGGRPGMVCSVAWSPALGRPIALAILPRDMAAPGGVVKIKQGEQEFAGAVSALPLVRAEAGEA